MIKESTSIETINVIVNGIQDDLFAILIDESYDMSNVWKNKRELFRGILIQKDV